MNLGTEEMSSVLEELEATNEKIKIILNDLNNEYFGDADPESWMLKYYYDTARIKLNIALDYLMRMGTIVNDLKKEVEIDCKK